MDELQEAISRVEEYLSALSRMQGLDREYIHGIGLGGDDVAWLRVSDIQTLLWNVKEAI